MAHEPDYEDAGGLSWCEITNGRPLSVISQPLDYSANRIVKRNDMTFADRSIGYSQVGRAA